METLFIYKRHNEKHSQVLLLCPVDKKKKEKKEKKKEKKRNSMKISQTVPLV